MMVINHNKSTLSIIYYYTTTEYYTGSYTLLEWDASQARYVTGDADTSLSLSFLGDADTSLVTEDAFPGGLGSARPRAPQRRGPSGVSP
jgi:hypothetical protein